MMGQASGSREWQSGVMVPVRETPGEKPLVKVFVIDPKKFQKDGNPTPTTVTAVHKQIINILPPPPPLPKRLILPAPAKENWKDDGEQDNLMSVLLTKKFKTRAGRVTKPRERGGLSTGPSVPTSLPPAQAAKVRRREPPEFFRCQTCQKFYVGNAKLKSHLKKFPTHEGSLEYQKTIAPKRKVTHTSVAIQFEEDDTPPTNKLHREEARTTTATVSVSPPPVASTSTSGPFRIPSSGATIFEPMAADLCDPNSPMTIPHIRTFNEVQSERLAESPSSNSLPFWNAFSSFSNTSQDESSPDDGVGPGSVGGLLPPGSRKEDIVDLNAFKTVWDLVEKKLVQNGINQILTELSDVAEKLGKIARDKIIPIREDEEERLPTSTPIVRVENPFMSHLLDLPFGTYVFREDGGIRRRPLPPPSTDLSLTAGEVDIDKFLACNMEMDLSLPHLTSLDIAAVCNN